MNLEEAVKLTEAALSTMQNREIAPSSNLILTLATNSALSAYDCEFVALADEAKCKLVTVDKQVIKNFPAIAISLEDALKQKSPAKTPTGDNLPSFIFPPTQTTPPTSATQTNASHSKTQPLLR